MEECGKEQASKMQSSGDPDVIITYEQKPGQCRRFSLNYVKKLISLEVCVATTLQIVDQNGLLMLLSCTAFSRSGKLHQQQVGTNFKSNLP
jgi:hypothetical protein